MAKAIDIMDKLAPEISAKYLEEYGAIPPEELIRQIGSSQEAINSVASQQTGPITTGEARENLRKYLIEYTMQTLRTREQADPSQFKYPYANVAPTPASESAPQIEALFQQFLGRAPRPDELDYFSEKMAKGQTHPMELSYFLQATPEYQAAQAEKSRQAAMQAAQEYDIATFPKFQEQVISRFAQMGRPKTTAMEGMLAQEMARIAQERGLQAAGMTREDMLRTLGMGYQQGTGTQDWWRQQQWGGMQFQQQMALQRQAQEAQRQLAALQNQWYQQAQPSFLESLIPGLAQGVATGAMYSWLK